MNADSGELRRINWREAFPFVRLFAAASRALGVSPMVLGFCCVASVYVVGRLLDSIWVTCGSGAIVATDPNAVPASEIQLFLVGGTDGIQAWQSTTEKMSRGGASPTMRAGPFQALVLHEMDCFSAGIESVLSGRLFSGAGPDSRTTLFSAIGAGLIGFSWLLQRFPLFSVLLAALLIFCFSFYGGAICRIAAVRSARGRWLGPFATLSEFSGPRWMDVATAPGVFIGAALLLGAGLFLIGLVGAIPWLGPVVSGLLFGLSLLMGLALGLAFLGLVLAVHLGPPAVAVERSDAFEGWHRSCTYIMTRPISFGFYCLVAMIVGSLGYSIVRLVAMFALKFTHEFLGAGMSWFGAWRGGQHYDVPRLDAMWRMPDWTALSILPSAHSARWWGEVAPVLTTWPEWIGMLLISVVLYLFVALVAGYVVSFYFCAATEVYLLLRREIDDTDFDEIDFVDPDEIGLASIAEAASAGGNSAAKGTSLPVVGRGPGESQPQ